jgi:hypothetical protein
VNRIEFVDEQKRDHTEKENFGGRYHIHHPNIERLEILVSLATTDAPSMHLWKRCWPTTPSLTKKTITPAR